MSVSSVQIPANFPGPKTHVGFQFWLKAQRWSEFIDARLKPYRITQSELFQLIALATLSQTSDEVTQTTLGRYTEIGAMTTSKVLRRLEKKSLLQRVPATDSRAKALLVTPAGWDLLVKTASLLQQVQTEYFPVTNKTVFQDYLNTLTK